MERETRFCGGCGATLKAGARFCGECGWAIPLAESPVKKPPQNDLGAAPKYDKPEVSKTAKAPPDITAAPAHTPSVGAAAHKSASVPVVLTSSVQWALVWLVGWIPVGVFMGLFWASRWNHYKAYYGLDTYDVSWGYTFPGAIVAFALAGGIGGFIAGAVFRLAFPQAPQSVKPSAVMIVVLWCVGWVFAILPSGLLYLSGDNISDDILMVSIFAAALVISIIAAQVAMSKRRREATIPATILKRILVSVGWVIGALLGIICLMLIIGL